MSNWWKSPVLQGEDNDYGQYDYMIEELPQDYARWELDKYKWKCHFCGRETYLLFRSAHYFHTLDGWDSIDYAECWVCRMKDKIRGIKRKSKKRIKTLKMARELHDDMENKSFSDCYKLAKKIAR